MYFEAKSCDLPMMYFDFENALSLNRASNTYTLVHNFQFTWMTEFLLNWFCRSIYEDIKNTSFRSIIIFIFLNIFFKIKNILFLFIKKITLKINHYYNIKYYIKKTNTSLTTKLLWEYFIHWYHNCYFLKIFFINKFIKIIYFFLFFKIYY